MLAEDAFALRVCAATVDHATVLTAHGVLDTSTYRVLRDEIIKAALEEPSAVIVEVSNLTVPAESALAVFTSARWHVGRWPETPIILACSTIAGRSAIRRNGVARYVPVYPTVDDAIAALSKYPRGHRHRARANLPAEPSSLSQSRQLVGEWLTAWSKADLIPAAKVIVTALIENVLQHTDSAPNVRVETQGETVTVAVEDGSRTPPSLSETRMAADTPTGLRFVDALSRVWGNLPTPSGKTVWAVIRPENQL